MCVQQIVETKVKGMKKGSVFAIKELCSLGSKDAVREVLDKLVLRGLIQEVDLGIYYFPKKHTFIPNLYIPVDAEDIARIWAKVNNYILVPQGMMEAYLLGFQTQSPMQTILWSNCHDRTFSSGNQHVEIRRVHSELLKWPESNKGRILRALHSFKDYELSSEQLNTAWRRLGLSPEQGGEILHRLARESSTSHLLPTSIITQFG